MAMKFCLRYENSHLSKLADEVVAKLAVMGQSIGSQNVCINNFGAGSDDDNGAPDIVIWLSEERGIELSSPEYDLKARVGISFHQGSNRHRRQFGGGKSQLIAKAVGIESGIYPNILDATAGFGSDAFVLAGIGSRVTAVERSSLLVLMLEQARQRALEFSQAGDSMLKEVLSRLHFIESEAIDYLDVVEPELAQVVYLDPMFPEKKKNASVKKDMVVLQTLLAGSVQNEQQLLDVALETASHRVVVKRPRHAPPIAGVTPGYALNGKSTRFDVYPKKALKRLD